MINLSCPTCGMELKIKEEFAGKSGKCKYCKESIRVPDQKPKAIVVEPVRIDSQKFAKEIEHPPGTVIVQRVESPPVTAPSVSWFIKVKDEVYGPYGLSGMKELAEIGRINESSQVAEVAEGPYYKASKIPAFFANVPEERVEVVNIKGAFCPVCNNRDSTKHSSGLGCMFVIFLFVSMGLALFAIPFLPAEWHCRRCGHRWKG